MFPPQDELRRTWSPPWGAWPQRYYLLRTVVGMGLAQRHRTGDGHGPGRGSHPPKGARWMESVTWLGSDIGVI